MFSAVFTYGQRKKSYFPIWTFHQNNINIYGVSVGLGSLRDIPKHTNTNGLKLEIIGAGIGVPLMSSGPIADNDSSFQQIQKDTISERINGISLSASGTVCNCIINGVSIGLIGQIEYNVNGFSATIFNFTQIHNGIQIGLTNETFKMSGIQIGFVNISKRTRGIQIGLWNVNERRKFPLINWNFRKQQ
jgi:hypothetical protein